MGGSKIMNDLEFEQKDFELNSAVHGESVKLL